MRALKASELNWISGGGYYDSNGNYVDDDGVTEVIVHGGSNDPDPYTWEDFLRDNPDLGGSNDNGNSWPDNGDNSGGGSDSCPVNLNMNLPTDLPGDKVIAEIMKSVLLQSVAALGNNLKVSDIGVNVAGIGPNLTAITVNSDATLQSSFVVRNEDTGQSVHLTATTDVKVSVEVDVVDVKVQLGFDTPFGHITIPHWFQVLIGGQ